MDLSDVNATSDDVTKERLRALGSAVADVSDRPSITEGGVARIRQSFLAQTSEVRHVETTSRAARRWRVRAAVGGLAAAAALSLGTMGTRVIVEAREARRAAANGRSDASLTFSVTSGDGEEGDGPLASDQPGVVGQWVAAKPSTKREAHFSDGSELALAPGARMRVTTTTPAGAEVLIEQGSVHMSVKHREQADARGASSTSSNGASSSTKWAVRAGPFEVHVTGTTFDAAWDPTAERFDLTMIEGRVLVSGPSLPPDRAVVAGEHLVVSVRDGRMVLARDGDPPSVGNADAELAKPLPSSPTGSSDVTPKPLQGGPLAGSSPVAAPAPPSWRELASAGKYADALALAEAAGFSQEVQRASLGDLWSLADAARYAGSAGRAKEALLAARGRFGARGQSAFLLGKIAADQQGSPGEAISWFETYLAEQPGAPLAEQALGRIVDLTRRARPDAAALVAARYLARYPQGSYAALARSLAPATSPGASTSDPAGAADGGLTPPAPR